MSLQIFKFHYQNSIATSSTLLSRASPLFIPLLGWLPTLFSSLYWSLSVFEWMVWCSFRSPVNWSWVFCALLQHFSPPIMWQSSGFLYWQQCFFSPFWRWHFLIAFIWAAFWASANASSPLHPSFHLVSLPFSNSVRGFLGKAYRSFSQNKWQSRLR